MDRAAVGGVVARTVASREAHMPSWPAPVEEDESATWGVTVPRMNMAVGFHPLVILQRKPGGWSAVRSAMNTSRGSETIRRKGMAVLHSRGLQPTDMAGRGREGRAPSDLSCFGRRTRHS